MKWNRAELDRLSPILEQISFDLSPVEGKRILVLCSAGGEIVFRLAEMMETGKVTGLELDQESLAIAQRSAYEMGLKGMVEFLPAEVNHIPTPEASFDALISDFIVYPTSVPTEIGQSEMARVLVPGGRMILTDVVATVSQPAHIREELAIIGLDYLCDANFDDFRTWMTDAGLINVDVLDLTQTVRGVWEYRHTTDLSTAHHQGYSYLLNSQKYGLGSGLFYVYMRGDKPTTLP